MGKMAVRPDPAIHGSSPQSRLFAAPPKVDEAAVFDRPGTLEFVRVLGRTTATLAPSPPTASSNASRPGGIHRRDHADGDFVKRDAEGRKDHRLARLRDWRRPISWKSDRRRMLLPFRPFAKDRRVCPKLGRSAHACRDAYHRRQPVHTSRSSMPWAERLHRDRRGNQRTPTPNTIGLTLVHAWYPKRLSVWFRHRVRPCHLRPIS